MMQAVRSRVAKSVLVFSMLGLAGCGAGSENDTAFLKEAGVGTPIKDYDKGYADRKERRQAELDAQTKPGRSASTGKR